MGDSISQVRASAATVDADSASSRKGARYIPGSLYRGYIKKIYYPSTLVSTTSEYAPNDSIVARIGENISGILCDVQIIESPQSYGLLQAVPILTTAWGIAERFQWVPRAVEHNLTGGDLNEQTPLHDTDADMVVVAFLDNDGSKPVIIGALPHPRTPHHATLDDSTHYKMRALVRGNEFQVEDQGKVVIDVRGQTRGYRYNESDGQYTASGNPTIEIKSNSSTVTVDDGTGTTIVAGDSTITVNADGNVTITTGATGTVEVTGNTTDAVRTDADNVALGDAISDIGTILTEFLPTIVAAGSLFGTASSLVNATTGCAGLASGTSTMTTTGTTGKMYTSQTLKSK